MIDKKEISMKGSESQRSNIRARFVFILYYIRPHRKFLIKGFLKRLIFLTDGTQNWENTGKTGGHFTSCISIQDSGLTAPSGLKRLNGLTFSWAFPVTIMRRQLPT
jgi:hypothetical protein